jgi:hypothetical protein
MKKTSSCLKNQVFGRFAPSEQNSENQFNSESHKTVQKTLNPFQKKILKHPESPKGIQK